LGITTELVCAHRLQSGPWIASCVYRRHATSDLFAVLSVATGEVLHETSKARRREGPKDPGRTTRSSIPSGV